MVTQKEEKNVTLQKLESLSIFLATFLIDPINSWNVPIVENINEGRKGKKKNYYHLSPELLCKIGEVSMLFVLWGSSTLKFPG